MLLTVMFLPFGERKIIKPDDTSCSRVHLQLHDLYYWNLAKFTKIQNHQNAVACWNLVKLTKFHPASAFFFAYRQLRHWRVYKNLFHQAHPPSQFFFFFSSPPPLLSHIFLSSIFWYLIILSVMLYCSLFPLFLQLKIAALLTICIYCYKGRAVTNVGRTCSPTLL